MHRIAGERATGEFQTHFKHLSSQPGCLHAPVSLAPLSPPFPPPLPIRLGVRLPSSEGTKRPPATRPPRKGQPRLSRRRTEGGSGAPLASIASYRLWSSPPPAEPRCFPPSSHSSSRTRAVAGRLRSPGPGVAGGDGHRSARRWSRASAALGAERRGSGGRARSRLQVRARPAGGAGGAAPRTAAGAAGGRGSCAAAGCGAPPRASARAPPLPPAASHGVGARAGVRACYLQ